MSNEHVIPGSPSHIDMKMKNANAARRCCSGAPWRCEDGDGLRADGPGAATEPHIPRHAFGRPATRQVGLARNKLTRESLSLAEPRL